MKAHKNRIYLIVCLSGIFISLLITFIYARAGMDAKKKELTYINETYSARLERLLESLFHKTDILEAVIITGNGDISENTFNNLARSLVEENKGIRAVQYLPGGTVTHCYPIEGNEKAIGGNVFKNEKRRADANLAKETHEITLSGPYNLTQGGFGIVARNPIYLTSAEGEEVFWGFSAIVLELPDALDSLVFEEIERNGFLYRLTAVVDGKTIEIAASEGYTAGETAAADIHVPNHSWRMELSSVRNPRELTDIALIFVCSLSVTFLCSMLVYMLESRNRNLKESADTDFLTGLINRRKLLSYMELRLRDKKLPLTLLYCDINHFKMINDTYGHDSGDIVLRETAQRIKRSLREEDIAARVGGDEFIIVIEHCGIGGESCGFIERLRAELSKPVRLPGEDIFVSLSMGSAVFPDEKDEVRDLIRLADERMYDDKKASRQS